MTGTGRVIGNNLIGAIERTNTIYSELLSNISEEEMAKHPYFESLTSQLFWTMRLLMKRHLCVFSPYEIIYNAEKLLDEMYKATIQNRPSTPFDHHSLALASMTLLEASVIPEYSEECWEHLKKLDEILDHRSARSSASTNGSEFEDILGTPAWDAKFRLFLEWRRAKAEESQIQEASLQNRRNSTAAPLMGPNEQRSLQHLADLAVGAEGSVAGNASPPPTDNQGNATSPRLATAQPQSRVVVDFMMLTHKGYLNVFSGVALRRTR